MEKNANEATAATEKTATKKPRKTTKPKVEKPTVIADNGLLQVEEAAEALSAPVEKDAVQVQIEELKMQIDELKQRCDSFYAIAFNTMDNETFGNMLRNEHDYTRWFEMLSIACKRFLVLLTVKDTAGDAMPLGIIKSIVDSGFANFRNDLWRSYIGVINKGDILCDLHGEKEQPISYSYKSLDKSVNIQCASEPWRNGNRGDIVINANNFAVDMRGVNVVVYDVENKKAVDSVAFDSHENDNFRFEREKQ